MPRGRAPGYAMQREEIVARAAELFASQGYTATSMNQVAEACGVSKPSLYHYVRDKYRLLVEICEGHVARLGRLIDEVESEGLDPQRRVERLIERFLDAYADARHAHRVLTEDVRFLEAADRKRVIDGERRVVAAFADAIAEIRPELGHAQLAKPIAMLLFGMMNWMFTWLKSEGALTHAAMAPIVASIFFGGLSAVQPPQRSAARRIDRNRRVRPLATEIPTA